MRVVPVISNYKPYYIALSPNGGEAIDTTAFGMVAQSQPYPLEFKAKEPYKNEWPDQHGDEEYLTHLYLESFEFEVKFYAKCKGENASLELTTQVREFLNTISSSGIAVYDSWQEIGYKQVRFVNSSVEKRKVGSDYAWMILSVKFKANNPRNTASLSSGNIV